MMHKMKLALLSILSVLIMVSCGNEPDGPLQDFEVEKIEDDLVEAIGKKKIKIYSDKTLEHQIDPKDSIFKSKALIFSLVKT